MLFNPKKPYRVVKATKADDIYYYIQQPVSFLIFILCWRKIEYRTITGIFMVKYFNKLYKAQEWVEYKKTAEDNEVVYDIRKCLPDFKGKIPPPPAFYATTNHQLIDIREDYETPGGLD